MIEKNYFEPDILSKREEIYNKLLNHRVVNMVRFGLEPKEMFSDIYNISDAKSAFSLSEGALLLEFDNNTSIAFNSDEELCSIISWTEKFNGKYKENLLIEDSELFPINVNDISYSSSYFSEVINQKLVKFEIIKQEPFSATYYSLPREVGLILYFSNNSQIVISHQLTKRVSDNFTVLEFKDIDKDIYTTLYKMSKYW